MFLENRKMEVQNIWKKEFNKKILVLIPLYKEESIIKNTIDYFSNIKDNNIELYFITTNKELVNWKNKTLNILEKTIDSKHIINYPFNQWDKWHQLNYAINKLLSKINNSDSYNSYFAIFDADSKPDVKWLYEVLNDKKNEEIYQMLSMYNINFHNTNLFWKANALIQSRRSIYFEKNSLLQNYKQNNKLMYLIWHWLFIRSDIAKLYKFPEDSITEDIVFWYTSNLNRIYAKPLKYFDHSTVPNKISLTIIQTSRRLIGEFDFVFNLLFKKKNILALERFIQLIQRWLWGSLVLISLIISIINSYNIFTAIIILAIIIDYLSLIIIYHKYFKLKINIETITIYLVSIFKNILDIIPTIISLMKVWGKILLDKKYVFNKTPR